MRRLPDRPDLDQLRRQAKELHRAGSRPGQTRRKSTTLAAAQLALARDYGFPSWARLKQEVERRRGVSRPSNKTATTPMVRSWESMREWMAQLLLKRTGADVEEWKQRIEGHKPTDEAALRAWLQSQGVTGYSQRLLVWETFGYPSFMRSAALDLIGSQYEDRPQLRPILDAILARLPDVSPVITIQARKTYISLVSERRTFAVVQATTRNRVDLGLRLEGETPGGRLESGKGIGNGTMPVKLSLASASDLDREAIRLLQRAYQANA